jgi:hypothetical protein
MKCRTSAHRCAVVAASATGLVVLLGMARPAVAGDVLATDFETDPVGQGWTAAGDPSANVWTDECAASGLYSLRAEDGQWTGPLFWLGGYTFHRVRFDARPDGDGRFWFQDDSRFMPLAASPGSFATHEYLYYNRLSARQAAICFGAETSGPVFIDDVVVSTCSRAEAATCLDAVYATMGQFDFAAGRSADRHDRIPITMQKLQQGQTANVVMLGDSIVSDTCWSYFDVLVDRMYPQAHLAVTPSVRGSTGCWWYREENRVQEYVLDHDPDLVMIGGISQRDDFEAIRDVIHQIRAGRPGTEIVLMTEAFGADDPYDHPEWLAPLDPAGSDYRANMWQLAESEGVAFLDMTLSWARYIVGSGLPYEHYKRDIVHSNFLGGQVLGRTLESYFAPVVPPCPGDANLDGIVDLQDFGLLKSGFGTTGGATWGDGDFNGDGAVDLQDFGLLKQHFGEIAGLGAIPEPATLLGLLAGAAGPLLRRRRQHGQSS